MRRLSSSTVTVLPSCVLSSFCGADSAKAYSARFSPNPSGIFSSTVTLPLGWTGSPCTSAKMSYTAALPVISCKDSVCSIGVMRISVFFGNTFSFAVRVIPVVLS